MAMLRIHDDNPGYLDISKLRNRKAKQANKTISPKSPLREGKRSFFKWRLNAVKLGRDYDLAPGDLLAFPGDQPHAYHNPGKVRCAAISVVALVPAGA